MPVISGILETVKNTGCLGKSPRQHDLLAYLLRENEAGRAGRIKAYSIAIDVLGRPEDFDTSIDSIVRVEMHRLRKGLALFNAGDNHFTLTIPKASYKISVKQKSSKPAVHETAQQVRSSTLFVLSLIGIAVISLFLMFVYVRKITLVKEQAALAICSEDRPQATLAKTKTIGEPSRNTSLALEINMYLRAGLSQYSKIAIIPENIDCQHTGSPSYIIQPTLFNATSTPFVSIDIQETRSQKTIYSQKITLSKLGTDATGRDALLFYKTASKIAHASGAIPQDAVSRKWASPQKKQNFQCQTTAYNYFVTNSEKHYLIGLQCLENAVNQGTNTPDIFGLLGIFYIEQYRGYQTKTRQTPFKDAEELLQQAHALSPFNSETLIGQLRIEAERPDINKDVLKNTIEIIERQHPYNAHILIVSSQTAGFKLGDWQLAKRLSERTLDLNHSTSYALHYVATAYALLYEDPETAYKSAQSNYSANSTLSILMNLAAANKAGRYKDAAQHKETLKAHKLHTTIDYALYITNRHYEPKLTQELIRWVEFKP